MLEFLRRHHKTFWIVVTAIVIISFTFWGSYTKTGNSPGMTSPDDTAFVINGEEYDYADYGRLRKYYMVASQLGLSVLNGRAGFAEALVEFAPRFRAREDVPRDFVFNLILLRQELDKLGIRASDAEVKEQFRRLPVFQTNGEVDRAKLEGFENALGSFGMRVSDVYDLVRDWIGMQKLIEIVGGNAVPSPYLATQFYAATGQTIRAATIPFALDAYKKSVKVTEEESKKYFEQNKDKFKTPEKRAVAYVLFESPKDLDKVPLEERIKKNGDFTRAVEDFSNAAFGGAKLEELAKKFSKEVKKLPAFGRGEQPEELKQEMALLGEIFRNDPKAHPVSEPVQSEKGYYFFAVTEIKESKHQEFKDAEPKIRELLTAQKAREEMTKAANDARKSLDDAIRGGKKFEEAAKAAKLEPRVLPEFTPTEPPKDLGPDGYQVAGEAQQTPPGSFSKKPVTTENGVLLVYVLSKQLFKRDDSGALKQRVEESLAMLAQRDLFRAWFERQRDAARLKSNLPEQM